MAALLWINMTRMRRLLLLGVALALGAPTPAAAWRAVAHRYITARAVELLPPELAPFFVHYRDELVLRSNDPDLWRVVGFDTEAPNHHIDFGVDDYGAYPFAALPREYGAAIEKFGATTVQRHGLLPWRTTEEFGNLRRMFQGFTRNQMYVEGNTVLFAAALAHYIQDAHQPLHAHINFDGQLSGQNGVHSRFESELFERFQTRLAIRPPALRPVVDANAFIWDVVLDSHQLVPTILAADKAAAAGKETHDADYFERFLSGVQPVLERQLSRAISATASAIVGAWEQAGRPPVRTSTARPIERVPRR